MKRAKKTETKRVDCDFPAIVLKGLIEQQHPGAYFGSWMSLLRYCQRAAERGWIVRDGEAWTTTDAGRRVYDVSGLANLPRSGRGYAWDWSVVDPEALR